MLPKSCVLFSQLHLVFARIAFARILKEKTSISMHLIVKSMTQQLDYLRGRTKSTNKESFAEKTMRKVYSEHKDTVDYDKLNKETVERLLEKGASDKSIREIAEIAKKLNPTIKGFKTQRRDGPPE